MKYSKYRLIEGKTIAELQFKVEKAFEDGYHPWGSPINTYIADLRLWHYAQAVVLPKE